MGYVTAFLVIFLVGAGISFVIGFAFADSLKEQMAVSVAAGTLLACAMCGIGGMMTRLAEEHRSAEVATRGYTSLREWIEIHPGEKPRVRKAMADGRITNGEYDVLSSRFAALDAAGEKAKLAEDVRTER
jgi:hypothetical protein